MNPDEIFELVEKYKKKRKDTRATIPSVNLAGRRELVDRLMQIPTRSTYQSSGYTTTEEDIAPVLTTSDEEELLSGMTPTQKMYHLRSGGAVDTSTSWGDKVSAVSKMILEGKDPDYAQTDTLLKQLQAQQERYKLEDVNSDSEQVELNNYYNQLWTAKYQDVLSKTKMDGQNHSIAEELKIITELSGDEKKKRKEAVIKKMEELGIPAENYALFTDDKNFSWGTFGKWLGANVDAGLNTLYSQYASTGDLLFGNILEGIGWENNPFTLADKYYEGAAAAAKTRLDLYAERLGGGGWNTAGEFGTATIAAVPEAIMWYWSAASKAGTVLTTSAELAANAAMQAGDFLEKAGLTVSKMMQNPKYWLSFAKTFGSDYDESKEKGMSDSKAVVSAVGKSLLNAVWENGLDGGSGIQGLADDLANGAKGLRAWFDSSVEEGLEEGIQKFTSETIDYVAGDRETEIYNPVEYLKEIAMGTGVGAVLGGGQIAADAVRNSHYQHQANKLTADEQTVLDKVVEEYVAEQKAEGKKLTASEIATFKKNAEERLRKGYITPEKIEEILGGDDYANYKAEMDAFKQSEDFVAYHNATQEKTKLAELEKEYSELHAMKRGEMTGEQIDREAELKEKIDDIKEGRTESELLAKVQPEGARVADLRNQMRSKVRDRVKGTRLAESYQELERRNQKPNLDVEKYTNETAKATVQGIKDSGLGDGTNEFADYVDYVANYAAKTNRVVKLMTEQQIKDANLWPTDDDGNYVGMTHGCIAPDGTIVLNYNSDRNLHWTVGHEIGHVIEKTKHSKALREALFNHAIAKEGIDKFNERLKVKEKDYSGMADTTPEIELANDLLGEYVFSDYEFVSNLAKTNRNLFHKMFDEVKHLYNMAVAGSKQQRELEKAKYLFQKALEEVEKGQKKTTAEGGTKQSIETLPDGRKYVRADRQVIYGTDPESWSEQVANYINGKIRNGENVELVADDGEILVLTEKTAGKISSNKTNHGTTMDDELFGVKANAGVHIDELAQISVNAEHGKKPKKDKGARHGEFAEGGWTYREAYFRDFDGRYYRLTISAAKGADGNVVYNIGNIEERSFPNIVGSSAKGGALNGKASFEAKVPQNEPVVKGKFSMSKENVGYHAGDLGKSEALWHQGLSRDTGHFGTGTYFVGNQAALEGYNKRDGKAAPVEKVDFEKYNLFAPQTEEDGFALHDFLRGVDGYWNRAADAVNTMDEYERMQGELNDLTYEIEYFDFGESDPSDVEWISKEMEFLVKAKRMMGDYTVGTTLTETLRSLTGDNYQYDSNNNEYYTYDFETDKFTHYDELDILKKLNEDRGGWRAFEKIEKEADSYYSRSDTIRYEHWDKSIDNIANILGMSKDEILSTIQGIGEEINSANYSYEDELKADSAATRFMKALGYEGIDVRGLKALDNTKYGSVIYDLKDEDLARKQEIGTAKFSMSKTVEETKDLVALHNLTAEKLLKSLELGGLPMPSIAITKADIPHDNFGEITLIMGKDTIDPKANKKNVVYSADAWTPTFPSVEYETDIDVERQINNRLLDLASKVEDVFKHDIDMMRYSHEDNLNRHGGEEGLIQYAMEKYGLKAAYLEDKGKHIEKVTEQVLEEKKYNTANTAKYEAVAAILGVSDANEVAKLNIRETIEQYGDQLEAIYPGITQTAMRTSRLLSLVKAYLEDQGGEPVYRTVTDEKAMRKAVDDAIDMEGFEAWTRELFAGIVKDKGIYNNKDLFTPSGNRKSFKQTHLPFTLENIVKAMASQNNGNTKNVSGFNGIKTLRAGTAERFKSIAAMHERKGRLQHLTQEEADRINDDLSSRLYNIMETIDNENGNKGSSNSFIRLDSIGETLMEISEGGKYNVSDIQGVFAKYGHSISDDLAADIKQLLYDVSQMPVNIYEAKPERAVTFDEVGVFVIPRNADIKLKQELLNRGYAIAEYDPEVEGDRNKVVNQFEEYKFSLSDASKQTPRERGAFNELWSDFGRTDPLDDFAPAAEDVAPAAEDVAPVAEETNVSAPVADVDDGFDRESFEAITDDDAPPVVEDEPVKEIKTAQDKLDAKIASTQAELDKNRQLREQSARDYDEEIAEQQRKYDSKKNKNSIAANDILRRIERLKRLKATNDANYEKRISDLEARVEKMSSPEYRTAEQRRSKMEQYTELWKNMIGDTSTWKDLAMGISYKTKTMRRFLRKVVRGADGKANIALADQIYDELETKYDHNEAQLKQESVKLKEVFKKLNLNHAEDTYAHMLGELRHNPQTTLTEDAVKEFYEKNKGKIDSEKVEKAISEARSTFDSLLIRVNNVLREQGMKEIPFRKGYFPHFTNPKQGWLAKILNWKTVDTEIPTSIAGLTEQFDPQRSWQGFNKQREGDTTDYSLYQGLDTYIHGALDWIYHIEDLQKRRSLENYIRYVHSEEGVKAKIEEIKANEYYDADEAQKQIELVLAEAANPLNNLVTELRARTNTLANKKASMDRGMEEATNRKIYSVMTNLNNRINANMVVGSFSSALTNFIPIAQSWHQVSPYYTVQGLGDMVRNAVKDDGMVAKSDFLTNRLVEEEKLYQTGWDKVTDKAAFMMNVIDHITSQTVWRSKYLQNLHEGMSETQAIKDADQFAKNLIAGRSRGNMPSIFDAKNPLIKIATAFQLEVANQYGYMFEDVPQDSKSPLRLVKGYTTAILGAYVYNALYSSLVGRDAAFDPMGIIEDLLRDLGIGDDDDDEEEVNVGDALLNLGENIVQELPYVGGLFGGGRVPMSSALPYSSDSSPIESLVNDVKKGWNEGDFTEGNWTPFVKEMLKPLYYLAMPVGGGQLKKTVEGLSMFSDDHPVSGSYTDNGDLRFPVEDTPLNRIQAALFGQYASENARYYFDNDLAPLSEKQIQEYQDVDIPIRDYWEYREGLKGLTKAEEKVAYINDLDLPISKKNILVNNQLDRKKKIDLTNYGDFDSLAEFDFANENPEKYDFFESIGVSYKDYANADTEGKAVYNWAFENPEKYTVSKVVTDDLFEYKQYTNDLNDIQADKDSSGKAISGSAKNKKIDYINSLNIEYGAKLILFKDAYPSDDTYNKDIIDYLNGRSDLSYDERVTILKELGFTVKNGKVYWD